MTATSGRAATPWWHSLEKFDLPHLHIAGHLLVHVLFVVEVASFHRVASTSSLLACNPLWFLAYFFFLGWSFVSFRALHLKRAHAFNLELSRVLFFLMAELASWALMSDEYVFLWYHNPDAARAAGIHFWVNQPLKLLRAVHVFSFLWLAGRYLWFPFFGYTETGTPLYLPGQPCDPLRDLSHKLFVDCIQSSKVPRGHHRSGDSSEFAEKLRSSASTDESYLKARVAGVPAPVEPTDASACHAVAEEPSPAASCTAELQASPARPDDRLSKIAAKVVLLGLLYRYLRGPLIADIRGCPSIDLQLVRRVFVEGVQDPEQLWVIACAFSGFLGVSTMCYILEKFRLCENCRIQPYKPNEGHLSDKEWCEALRVSLFNACVVAVPVGSASMWYWRNVSGFGTELSVQSFVWQLVCCVLFIEVWFYWTHRLLHVTWFYKRVHKFHHRFTYPSAVCAMYAHWFEFSFGNQIGVVMGPALIGAHPYVGRLWVFICLANTSIAHSGFSFVADVLDGMHHDLHHEFFKCNYGVTGLCDWLFGTDASDFRFDVAKADKLRRFHAKQAVHSLDAQPE